MEIPYWQVDAFAARVFEGNPAGVCLLEKWPPDGLLAAVAAENRLSETAFLVPLDAAEDADFHLRWFTPSGNEVDLCGHATLASAHVVAGEGLVAGEPAGVRGDRGVRFRTRSGVLSVHADGDRLAMDFPARPAEACPAPEPLVRGLGATPEATAAAVDYVAEFGDEQAVRELDPTMEALAELDLRGVIATAPGEEVDFVSRFFAPVLGVPEDPVTGSAHCTLAPYWADRLGRDRLRARQVSGRGGDLWCRVSGDRVEIAGTAADYLEGTLTVPEPGRESGSR